MSKTNEAGALIVTGAARGIGAAVAKGASKYGFAVAVNFARSEARARQVVREICSSGGRAIAIQGDVSREEDVLRLFETAERELGPIKGLVNNAGITGGFARVEAVSAKAVADVMAVNVTGSFLCAREAARGMSTRRGGSGAARGERSSGPGDYGTGGAWRDR